MRVVIADDSQVVRERLASMLSELPYIEILDLPEEGMEAIHIILEQKPDAVILDIRMPRASGIEVLEEIRKHNAYKPLIIICTNYPYPHYRKKCMDAGADFFLDKSREFEKIREIFEEYAKKKNNRDSC